MAYESSVGRYHGPTSFSVHGTISLPSSRAGSRQLELNVIDSSAVEVTPVLPAMVPQYRGGSIGGGDRGDRPFLAANFGEFSERSL